jgi:hypothetical protein
MLLRAICFCVLLSTGLIATSNSFSQVVERSEFVQPKDGISGSLRYMKSIQVSSKIAIDATLNVTAKGNGILDFANLHLKVFDDYHDEQVFDHEGLLHVEFVDVDGDGFKDLVISGIVRHMGEKESDPVSEEALVSVYLYDKSNGEYRLAYRLGPKLEF